MLARMGAMTHGGALISSAAGQPLGGTAQRIGEALRRFKVVTV